MRHDSYFSFLFFFINALIPSLFFFIFLFLYLSLLLFTFLSILARLSVDAGRVVARRTRSTYIRTAENSVTAHVLFLLSLSLSPSFFFFYAIHSPSFFLFTTTILRCVSVDTAHAHAPAAVAAAAPAPANRTFVLDVNVCVGVRPLHSFNFSSPLLLLYLPSFISLLPVSLSLVLCHARVRTCV